MSVQVRVCNYVFYLHPHAHMQALYCFAHLADTISPLVISLEGSICLSFPEVFNARGIPNTPTFVSFFLFRGKGEG